MNNKLSYTYWSYEEYGKCYIGVRQCPKKYPTPELDNKYFGSYSDKSFKPTHKIILNVFDNHEDAKAEEVELHKAFDVGRNTHFANRAKQTSTGFSTAGTTHNEEARKKMSAAKRGENNPFHDKKHDPETLKKMSEAKSGENNYWHGKKHNEETKQKMSKARRGKRCGEKNPNYGKPSPNRNQEVWDNYQKIKDLHIDNPELGYVRLCKLFNETFGTNYPGKPFQNILKKIKEEIVQRNS